MSQSETTTTTKTEVPKTSSEDDRKEEDEEEEEEEKTQLKIDNMILEIPNSKLEGALKPMASPIFKRNPTDPIVVHTLVSDASASIEKTQEIYWNIVKFLTNPKYQPPDSLALALFKEIDALLLDSLKDRLLKMRPVLLCEFLDINRMFIYYQYLPILMHPRNLLF